MIVKLGAVLSFTPIFIVPATVVGVWGRWIGQIYVAAQLPIKRELSNAKAPVLAQYVSYTSIFSHLTGVIAVLVQQQLV